MRKRLLAVLVIAPLLLPLSQAPKAVAEEKCRTFNFDQVFNFGYNKEFPTWTKPGVAKVITWATLDSGELNNKKVQRSFGDSAKGWLRTAFQSWDDALDSITFKEIEIGENPDIKVGWTQVLQLDYESLFNVKAPNDLRNSATIEFKHTSTFLIFKDNFIQAAQSDIGHILGMGYITPTIEFVSVMEWPFEAPYGQVPLGEFDASLIRAIYSESTCPSTFSPVIQAKIKEIESTKAAAEKEAAEKAEAERALAKAVEEKLAAEKAAAEKAAAEKAAAAKLAAAKAKLAASKKIVCKKGYQTKTFIAPKCPPGWVKAKTK